MHSVSDYHSSNTNCIQCYVCCITRIRWFASRFDFFYSKNKTLFYNGTVVDTFLILIYFFCAVHYCHKRNSTSFHILCKSLFLRHIIVKRKQPYLEFFAPSWQKRCKLTWQHIYIGTCDININIVSVIKAFKHFQIMEVYELYPKRYMSSYLYTNVL